MLVTLLSDAVQWQYDDDEILSVLLDTGTTNLVC